MRKPKIGNKAATARHCGVGVRVVEGWISDGLPVLSMPADKHGEYAIDLQVAERWAAGAMSSRSGAQNLDAARARLAEQQADVLEIKIRELRASLLPQGDVQAGWKWAQESVRQVLHDAAEACVPGLVATACRGEVEDATMHVQQELTQVLDAALVRLSQMELD